MLDKKEEEFKTLKKIYNDNIRYNIIESEKPDFIVKDLKYEEEFGVEITELYYNQSSARLQKIPNYTYELLKNGIPRNDQGILNVQQIYISINNKWEYLGDTIGQKFKKYDDYIEAIVNTIITKTKKAKDYKKLKYLELFIEDKERYLQFKKISDLKYLENSEKLNKAISSSLFKRIYLFTIIDKMEILLIIGDIHSGALYTNENDIKKHQAFMKKIFDEKI